MSAADMNRDSVRAWVAHRRLRGLLCRAREVIAEDLLRSIEMHRFRGQSNAEVLANRKGDRWIREAHHDMRRLDKLIKEIDEALTSFKGPKL